MHGSSANPDLTDSIMQAGLTPAFVVKALSAVILDTGEGRFECHASAEQRTWETQRATDDSIQNTGHDMSHAQPRE